VSFRKTKLIIVTTVDGLFKLRECRYVRRQWSNALQRELYLIWGNLL